MADTKPSSLGEIISTNRFFNSNYKIDLNDNNNKRQKTNNKDYCLPPDFVASNQAEYYGQVICIMLGDTKNFNFYIKAVIDVGATEAYRLCQETVKDIDIQRKKGKPVRNPGAIFQWKLKQLKILRGKI